MSNRCDITDGMRQGFLRDYAAGMTSRECAEKYGVSISTVRRFAIQCGANRDRFAAMKLAGSKGRLSHMKGVKRAPYSAEQRARMSRGRQAWAEKNAKGVSRKKRGHFEYTRGPNRGRLVHVVMMEERLGRRLKDDECVHHIDGNPGNNDWNNLALCTTGGHARLHRLEEKMSGKTRTRRANGTFSEEAK